MRILLLTLILCFSLSFQFSISQNLAPSDQISNLTDSQQNLLKKYLSQAQQLYSASQYNQISSYIFQKLKNSTNYVWSTYITSNSTNQLAFYGLAVMNKFMWKTHLGKYNNSFTIWVDNTCMKQAAGTPLSQFGSSVNQTLRDKIFATVNNSIVSRGENMEGAAQYIGDKLGSAWNGPWTVLIMKDEKGSRLGKQQRGQKGNQTAGVGFGFYQCRLKEFWAYLRGYGEFGWTYYMSRSI